MERALLTPGQLTASTPLSHPNPRLPLLLLLLLLVQLLARRVLVGRRQNDWQLSLIHI